MKINIWQIAFLVALIIILYMGVCKRSAAPVETYEKDIKRLTEKVKQDSVDRYNDSLVFELQKQDLFNQRLEVIQKLDAAEIRLYQSVGTINRLSDQLRRAKELPFDSSFIYVAPEYVDACDSLATVAVEQGKQIEQAKKDVEQAWDLLNYEVYIRDSAIQEQRKDYAQLRADFNAQTHFFELAVKNSKPRTKLFVGPDVFGNNKLPLSGAGVGIDLLTKKEHVLGIGAGFNTMRIDIPETKDFTQWYGKISYRLKISFR